MNPLQLACRRGSYNISIDSCGRIRDRRYDLYLASFERLQIRPRLLGSEPNGKRLALVVERAPASKQYGWLRGWI
jgi:hypothetical protein